MKSLLVILAVVGMVFAAVSADAQSLGGACLLDGFLTPPPPNQSGPIQFTCYGLDSNFAVKAFKVCPTYLGFFCSAFAQTATFTKSGANLTGTVQETILPIGYTWVIQYCAAGQSGANCTPAGAVSGGSAVGNCRQAIFGNTTDELGRIWSCIHN